MKVVFLTASTSRNAGGLYFTITNYTKALKKLGVDVTVVGIDDEFSAEDRAEYGDVPVIAYTTVNLPLLSTFGMSRDLSKILEQIQPEIIHLQGLWMYHSWAALKYKSKHPEVKILIEPHGMLDAWALQNSKWKKKIVGHLFEYANLKNASCIHALCESEKESILSLGLNNNVVIIPNGISIPQYLNHPQKKDTDKKVLLYIGRIHPKKGLELLIEAFNLAKQQSPSLLNEWKCRIAGWDQNNYQEYLESKVVQYQLEDSIKFTGPVFNEVKTQELNNADVFILPSFSEGLPMSILEAWSYRLPVIMTDFCNLPEGFEYNAAIKIDTNPQSILDALIKMSGYSKANLIEMGLNAQNLVNSKFTWDSIAKKTLHIYNNL